MKKWFMEKADKYIERLEDESVPLIYYIGTFISILFIRDFIEVIVYRQRFDFEVLVIRYNPFYVGVLLSLCIIFYLATKEKIEKIARVLLASFSLILLGPLIDLFVYGRGEYQITYLRGGTYREAIRAFFTLGPLEEVRGHTGISIGMRIEVLVILFLCFVYFVYKNKDRIKSLIFSFTVYASLVFFGAIIFLLNNIFDSLETVLRILPSVFLFIIIVLLSILFYLVKRRYLIELIKDIRPYRTGHFFLMFILGLGIGHRMNPIDLTPEFASNLILTLLSILFAGMFLICLNNIEDYEIDKVSNKKRPLVTGAIPLGSYKRISIVFLLLALVYSLAAGYKPLFFIILGIGNYLLYSAPPFRLKRIPILSKLPIALNSMLLLFLGHSFTGELFDLPAMIPIFFLTIYALAINFIDIKDHEGDKKRGIKTLPVLLGLKKAKLLIGTSFALAVFLSYFPFKEIVSLGPTLSTLIVILLGAVGVIGFYLINRDDYEEGPVFMTYLVLLFLLTYLIFIL